MMEVPTATRILQEKRNSGKNALNAVGFFCSQILGRSPNTKKAFESANLIDAAGFQLNDIYYVYYGTLAAYQHQGPVWEKWLDQMQNKFVSSQLNDGSWPVGAGHMEIKWEIYSHGPCHFVLRS